MKNYIIGSILFITSLPLQMIMHRVLTVNFEWLNGTGYGLFLFLSQMIFCFVQFSFGAVFMALPQD
jgi:hypothetical protein